MCTVECSGIDELVIENSRTVFMCTVECHSSAVREDNECWIVFCQELGLYSILFSHTSSHADVSCYRPNVQLLTTHQLSLSHPVNTLFSVVQ